MLYVRVCYFFLFPFLYLCSLPENSNWNTKLYETAGKGRNKKFKDAEQDRREKEKEEERDLECENVCVSRTFITIAETRGYKANGLLMMFEREETNLLLLGLGEETNRKAE